MTPRAPLVMKDSGSVWLGKIPKNWEMSRIGSCFEERKTTVSDTEYPPLSVTKSGVVPQLETAAKSDNSEGRKLVKAGDFVINSRSDRKGSAGLSEFDGSTSVIYTVLKPRHFFPPYVHHLLRSEPFQEEFYRWGTGIVADLWSTRYSAMKQIPVPVPPIEEQRLIAEFLDRETAQIDELIDKQQQLIETLTERRKAVITRAVTRGLDPTVELRDSGIYWLKGIASHWSVRRFNQVVTISGGLVDPRVEPYSSMTLVAPNHIEKTTGRLLETSSASAQGADSGKYLAQKGQVLYSKIRPSLQKAVIAPEECLCSADMYAMTGSTGILDNRFLQLLLLSPQFTSFVMDASERVAMPKVNREALSGAVLWFPPLEEQAAILTYLEVLSAKIDALSAKADQVIEVLKERRRALISAAVTGRIDVRGN